MASPYVPPELDVDAFNCPLCDVYAHQQWSYVIAQTNMIDGLRAARCRHCSGYSLWLDGRMLFPPETTAPRPSTDLPEGSRGVYEEARLVLGVSPRSAAALLRLVVQQLTVHLGKAGDNLNADIGSLVADGLPVKVQRALDIVRVVGNNSVHPGQIDITDDQATALQLFNLVNLIVDVMISQPAAINAMFESLPPGSRAQVQERDAVRGNDAAATEGPT